VFWKKEKRSLRTVQDLEEDTLTDQDNTRSQTTVFTDGSCSHTTQNGKRAGSGVWFGENNIRKLSIRLPDRLATNNVAELTAIIAAVSQTNTTHNHHIISDSKYVIDGLTKHCGYWEDIGWIEIKNHELFMAAIAALRLRQGKTTFEKVKGHSGVHGNEVADRLAAEGARKESPDNIDTSIPEEVEVSGARLQSMTQAILYTGILENRERTERKTTAENLEIIAESIRDRIGYTPEPRQVWESLRNRALSKNIRAFLWKTIHGAHRCGKFWSHIPNFEQRALCPTCGVTENMDHILTECQSSGQRVIWENVRTIMGMKGLNIDQLNFGSLLGCALRRKNRTQYSKAHDRLYTVVLSESIFLIWRTRCEWRIQRESDPTLLHSETEIHNKWVKMINYRLKMDCLMTNSKYERKALSKKLVIQTWSKTILEENANMDWTNSTEVLVGIKALRPPGRNR
jgi:ribonuclease HI